MKTILIVIALIVLAGILIWVFTRSSYKSNPSTTSSSQTEVASPNTVNIANFSFQPANLEVSRGTKVVWTNNDSTAHTITSDTGIFNSDKIQPGKTFEFTFKDAGTFAYHCSIHTTMKGTVVVK